MLVRGRWEWRHLPFIFIFFPSLLISLCQLNTQHAWPGWTALTTCPGLRWKFIQRGKKKKKDEKIKTKQKPKQTPGIPMCRCRDCGITGTNRMFPASTAWCHSSELWSVWLCSVLLSQPNPVKGTGEMRGQLGPGCFSFAGGFKIQAASFAPWQRWPGGCPGKFLPSSCWASLRARLCLLSLCVKSMGLLTEKGNLVRMGWQQSYPN